MKFGRSGTEALAVPGRKTGNEQTIPVIPVDYEGARYLVTPRGETQWVRNVRAAGTLELRSKKKATKYRANEVAVAERAPIIAAYREKAGRTVSAYFKKLPDAVAPS
ncbi:MAG: nitroreductase/quinone reductase family protein [Actinomycetota bacterium]|nr:nitroreductase/quinone reductase family protein [Actinomycetota bacterium]